MSNQKAVVITGASSGIGLACARRLASRGFRVFAGVRKQADADRLAALAPDGAAHTGGVGSISPIILDVTENASIAAATEDVRRRLGEAPLHGLVNNAGITVAGPLEMLPIDQFKKQLDVNLVGQIAVTQAFLPLLRKSHGRIVIMGSILGRFALPFLGAYSCAKFALEAVADTLNMELAGSGITVSIIEPGNIATPIWEKSKETAMDMIGDLSQSKWDNYRDLGLAFLRYVDHTAKTGIQPDRVAAAVEKALSSRNPRRRYPVGPDSTFLGRFVPVLPPSIRQALVRRYVARR